MKPDEYKTVRDLICWTHNLDSDCGGCPLCDLDSCYGQTPEAEAALIAFLGRCPKGYEEEEKEECRRSDSSAKSAKPYPQDTEEDEYRYIDAGWLEAVARGLTAGAKKHPGETWRQIPPEEHAARAMRCMMAYATEKAGKEGEI